MIRTSRTPTFILIALLVVILVLTYNYWSLSEKNQAMRNLLYKADEKKLLVEKENHINSGRVKYFEDRADALQKSNKEKDDEIAQLKSKVEEVNKENTRLNWESDDKRAKLEKCAEDYKAQISELTGKHQEDLDLLRINNTNLNSQINKLLATIAQDKVKLTLDNDQKKQICSNETNAALDEFRSRLAETAKQQLDAQTAAKVQALIQLKPAVEVADRIIKAADSPTLLQSNPNQTATATVPIQVSKPPLVAQVNAEANQIIATNDLNEQAAPAINHAQVDAPDRNLGKRDARVEEADQAPVAKQQLNLPVEPAAAEALQSSFPPQLQPSDDAGAAPKDLNGVRRL